MVVLPMKSDIDCEEKNCENWLTSEHFITMLHAHKLADFQACPGKDLIEECTACKTVQ